MNNKYFFFLFWRKESQKIAGKNGYNFWILISILSITFLSIGFANGSMDYLSLKMDDPFIKWVNIAIPYSKSDQAVKIKKELSKPDKMSYFNYEQVNTYLTIPLFFSNKKEDNEYQFIGRDVLSNSKLLEKILSNENLVFGNSENFTQYDFSLIITREMLQKLDYEKPPSHLALSYSISKEKSLSIPIPVKAVVKHLPANMDYISSQYFMNLYLSHKNYFNINKEKYQKDLIYFFQGSEDELNSLKNKILKLDIVSDIDVNKVKNMANSGYKLFVYWKPEKKITTALINKYNEVIKKKSNKIIRIYNIEAPATGVQNSTSNFDYLSVQFNDLDRLRSFSQFMGKNYDLKIDMAQIESKENYNFVSGLTFIISLALAIFSILSIVFFLQNLISNHIQNIKKNLGTFKAFGLSDNLLVINYMSIVFVGIALSQLVALVISFLVGKSGALKGLLELTSASIEKGQNYFTLFDSSITWIAITLLFFINLLVVNVLLKKKLNNTPGDLIYGRK